MVYLPINQSVITIVHVSATRIYDHDGSGSLIPKGKMLGTTILLSCLNIN